MVSAATSHAGIAISSTELCAVRTGAGGTRDSVFRAPLEPFTSETGLWPSLTAALRDLARNTAGGTLSVVLMPPLAEVRALDLPALREDEQRMLVTRNAQRYFVGARGQQLVAVAASRRRAASEPTVVAAASMRLITAISAAARDSGWMIDSIAPAEGAWAAAAKALWPAFAQRTGQLIVLHHDHTDMIHLRDGRVDGVRRFRSGAADASRIAEAINTNTPAAPRVGVVGNSESRKELTRALSAAGISVNGPSAQFLDVAELPEQLAAAFAGPKNDLVLRTDDLRGAQQKRAKRFALYIAAAAVVLVIIAGTIELWGVRRQLRDVQAQRAALKPKLAATLVGRTSIETAYRQLGVINASERTTPQWTVALVRIAEHLNEDAYLTAFRGRGDSVVVEGIADHAASVFTDLEKTPGLSRINAAAPVRREAPNGADATERFTIAAHLGEVPQKTAAAKVAK